LDEAILVASKKSGRAKKIIQSVARVFTRHPAQFMIPTRLDHKTPATDIPTLSTGLRPLDKTLGIGGLPCGKITELIGPGRTSTGDGVACIAAKIGSKVQRQQQIVTIIDMNYNFDPWQAERCGLIAPQLLLTRPDTVFDALTTLESAARSEGLAVINMGVVAELLRHASPDLLKTLLGRLRTIVRQSECVFLFVTRVDDNNPFNPTNYPLGFPLAELADIRLWVQNENWTYKEGLATLYKANLTVIKNRLAAVGTGADVKIKLTSLQ
jgi:RecA/RadA recombinase